MGTEYSYCPLSGRVHNRMRVAITMLGNIKPPIHNDHCNNCHEHCIKAYFTDTCWMSRDVTWENVPSDMCAQIILRSACAYAQADLSLRCPLEESLDPCPSKERPAKTDQTACKSEDTISQVATKTILSVWLASWQNLPSIPMNCACPDVSAHVQCIVAH